MRMASGTPAYAALPGAIFLVLTNGAETAVRLPGAPAGGHWHRRLDTAQPGALDQRTGQIERIAAESVVAFVLCGLADSAAPGAA